VTPARDSYGDLFDQPPEAREPSRQAPPGPAADQALSVSALTTLARETLERAFHSL